MSSKLSAVLGTVIISVAMCTMAYAGQSSRHENDAIADLSKAQVSITQAIAIAEQSVGGKATRAELENEGHGLIYKVEVANTATKKVMNVHVDAASGKVLTTKEDHVDHQAKDEADDD